jgi:Pyruvate kinase, barrel domain
MFRTIRASSRQVQSHMARSSLKGQFQVPGGSFFHGPVVAGSSFRRLSGFPVQTTFDLPDPAGAGATSDKAFQLTKIVATIGPTSENMPTLGHVANAGMKIMRLNFSHATVEEVELRTKNLALSQVCGSFYL